MRLARLIRGQLIRSWNPGIRSVGGHLVLWRKSAILYRDSSSQSPRSEEYIITSMNELFLAKQLRMRNAPCILEEDSNLESGFSISIWKAKNVKWVQSQ